MPNRQTRRLHNNEVLVAYKNVAEKNGIEVDPDFIKWLEKKNPNGYEGWKHYRDLQGQVAKKLLTLNTNGTRQ